MSNQTYFHLTGICELSGVPIITKDDAPRDDGSLLIQVVNEFGQYSLDELKSHGANIQQGRDLAKLKSLKQKLYNEVLD